MNVFEHISKNVLPIEETERKRINFEYVSGSNYSPPTYMVQILFLKELNLKNYGMMEKVLWHTYFKYKDVPFMIRDSKLDGWIIESDKDIVGIEKYVEELKKKISIATGYLDKHLYTIFKTQLDKQEYFLNNTNYYLRSLYDFYFHKVKNKVKLIAKQSSNKNRLSIDLAVKRINKELAHKREVSFYTFGLVTSFFSYLDFILEAFYLMLYDGRDYLEYKKLKWKQKFMKVFNIKVQTVKSMYEVLLQVRNDYRNPLSHGLIDQSNILIPLKGIGLIPLSYEFLSEKIQFQHFFIEEKSISELVQTCSSFFKFIKQDKKYKLLYLYLNYGFSIPCNQKDIVELKRKMSSPKQFKYYLERRAHYEDDVRNRDI